MEKACITLLGFPGSGKTTLGQSLAMALDCSFFDLDQIIEEKEGLKITEIFQIKGEDYFRRLERDELKNFLSKHHRYVLALGGGTPCFFDNMILLNQYSTSVFIDIPIRKILQRIGREDLEKRPLFRGLDNENAIHEFEERFGWRRQFYEKAKIKLKEDTATVDTILLELTKKG